MTNNRYYIDLHVLQTVPPSCVNRDDTGSPKTAVYGGVTRARVSSQAWKHAMRAMFNSLLKTEQVGVRTKRIVDKVAKKIREIDPNADGEKMAIEALGLAGLKIKNAEKGTDALFFMSDGQAKALAELICSGEKDKKRFAAALRSSPSVDRALFGRMGADDPSLNYDAAAQVAHSISTHAVQNEYDYFTAVDDCSAEDNAGAGHLGTVEFNSSTLYRYATVNVDELRHSIGTDTAAAVRAFAEAFIYSMPTGKQNTFANRTVPEMVYVAIRRDQPVNLVGAFEKPVRTLDGGYSDASEKRFTEYAKQTYEKFTSEPETAFGTSRGDALTEIADAVKLSEMLDMLEKCVSQHLSEGGEAE